MYRIRIIQAPKTLFFDETDGREMESIISINGNTEVNGIKIWLNIEESRKGTTISFKDENNREFKLKDSLNVNDLFDIKQDIYEILKKLAYATLYDELGKEGNELNSEDILEWDY
jgi:hypothetical protein